MTFVSPSVEFVIGFTPEEMMRMSFFDVLEEEFRREHMDAFIEFMKNASQRPAQDRTMRAEVPFRKKDGDILWVEVVATPILDHAGKLISIV